jgi:hypothetical protein
MNKNICSLPLTMMLVFTAHLFAQPGGNYMPITVESEITGVQPMTGIVFWTTSPNNETDAISLEYSYMLFNEIVTDSGDYNWDKVEQKLDAVAGRMHQAIFRFRYTYPGQQTSVPEYIKNLPDYEETMGKSEGRDTWFPDWTHPELERFTLEFYSKFAERYDQDPRLAFIEVGFGLWAEYHIYDGPFILGKTFPSKAFQETFFYHLQSVFLHTPWCISIDAADDTYSPFEEKPELKEIRFGLFDDSFMHEKHSTYPEEYNMSGWKFFGEERFKTSPAGGEFSYYTDYDQQHVLDPGGPYGRSFEDFAAQYHITFMIGNDQPEYQTMDRIREAGMATGYEFGIVSFQASPDSSIVTVKNYGIAPFYHDAFVTVNGVRAGESLKNLAPGEEKTFDIASGGDDPVLTIESDRLVPGQQIGFWGTDYTGTNRSGPADDLGMKMIHERDRIHLFLPDEELSQWLLYDLSGRIILVEKDVSRVTIGPLFPGIYLLLIRNRKGIASRKISM